MDDKLDLFQDTLVAINVGIRDSGSALEQQGVQVIYVDWALQAEGD